MALVRRCRGEEVWLFAIIAAFFMPKFAKVGLLALAAFGGGLWKLFGGKKKEAPAADMRDACRRARLSPSARAGGGPTATATQGRHTTTRTRH